VAFGKISQEVKYAPAQTERANRSNPIKHVTFIFRFALILIKSALILLYVTMPYNPPKGPTNSVFGTANYQ
jgi:hypothetical protein